ncbi:unnamed protein product, partial [Nesidiocoris tenuis]
MEKILYRSLWEHSRFMIVQAQESNIILDCSWSQRHCSLERPLHCERRGRHIIKKHHRDTQETLAVLDRLDLDSEKPSDEELARKFGFEEDYFRGTVSWWQRLKPQLWSLFDEPYSSNAAK